jgi:hypothetical protein
MQGTHAALTVASALCGWAVAGLIADPQRRRAAIALCAIVVVLTALQIGAMMNNRRTAVTARDFAREWDQMDAGLRGLETRSLVVIPAPRTVGNLDFLTPSPQRWANHCVADYYRIWMISGKAP